MKKNSLYGVFYGAMLMLACPAFAQRITEKTFFQRQNDYIKQVGVESTVIMQKRIPFGARPTNVKFSKTVLYQNIDEIQKCLDNVYTAYAAKKEVSDYWESYTIINKIKELKKADERMDIAPYVVEWEIYDAYFTQKRNERSEKIEQVYKAKREARSRAYQKLQDLLKKTFLDRTDIIRLEEGIAEFADSTTFREVALLAMANSGSSGRALEIQTRYIEWGTIIEQKRSHVIYERIKIIHDRPTTRRDSALPANTTKTTSATKRRTTTKRK